MDSNYTENRQYNESEITQLTEVFSKLYDDFFELLNNRKAKVELVKQQEKVVLESKIEILHSAVYTLLFISVNQEVLTDYLLKEAKVYEAVKAVSKYAKFETFNTISENIAIIERLIKSNEANYLREYGDVKAEQTKYTFEKQVVDVEQVLGRSLFIESLNVIQWVEYINKVQEIIKHKQKENGRNRK